MRHLRAAFGVLWVVGSVLLVPWHLVRPVLDFIGYADLIIAHATDPGWMGVVFKFLEAPPGWLWPIFVLIGGLLIWWDLRGRNRQKIKILSPKSGAQLPSLTEVRVSTQSDSPIPQLFVLAPNKQWYAQGPAARDPDYWRFPCWIGDKNTKLGEAFSLIAIQSDHLVNGSVNDLPEGIAKSSLLTVYRDATPYQQITITQPKAEKEPSTNQTRRKHSSDYRGTQHESAKKTEVQIVVFSRTITTFLRQVGDLKWSLSYQYEGAQEVVFDEIAANFQPYLYDEDFDGDGESEIVVEYLCGAHSMALAVYKVMDVGAEPTLIPGARIGSDALSIKWFPRKDDRGVVIVAKNRELASGNSAGAEAAPTFFIFDKNHCIKTTETKALDVVKANSFKV